MHQAPSSFVTLTYADDCLESPSLNYPDFQLFIRRLRRNHGPTRFFCAAEYGAHTARPHFHALLFGRTFKGLEPIGKNICRSPQLESLWPFGFSSVGEVNFQTAAYVASYSLKSGGTGDRSEYQLLDPHTGELVQLRKPFVQMSRRPGIGYSWFQKYYNEVYGPRDGVCLPGGKVFRAPRYYDKLLEVSAPDLKEYRDFTRYVHSGRFVEDSSPARLLSRELCALASQKMKGTRL